MEEIFGLLRKAGRRLSLNAYLDRFHWIAIYVASLACVVALSAKGFPAVESLIGWSWLAPVLIGAAVLGAVGLWVRRRPTTLHVAIEVDERLALREKISTAMVCRGQADGFAQAAVEDAIQVARDPKTSEKVRRFFPIGLPARWWLSPAFVAAAVLITLFVPNGDLLARDQAKVSAENLQRIKEYQKQVEDTLIEVAQKTGIDREELKKLIEDKPGEDIDNPGERDDPQSPEEAQKETFKDLKRLEEALREQTESEKAQALRELENRLGELDVKNKKGAASELGKALQQGDFKKARAALEEMKDALKKGELNEEQQKALADQLQKLAEQMDQLAKQNKALEDALKQAGLDANMASHPADLLQALQNAQNLTPAQKQQLQQMAQAMANAGQMMQKMSGAMKQMAQGMPCVRPGGGMPGAGKMGDQLSQMEMMQQQMNSLQQTISDIQSQCNGLGQGMGVGNKAGLGQGQAMAQWQAMMQQMQGGKGGMGNHGRGNGGRASRLATKGSTTPDKVNVERQQGPIIGETYIESDGQIRGESRAAFVKQVQTASNRSRQELENNKIGVEYEDAVKHFFGELEALAETTNAEVVTTDDGNSSSSSGDSGHDSSSSSGDGK